MAAEIIKFPSDAERSWREYEAGAAPHLEHLSEEERSELLAYVRDVWESLDLRRVPYHLELDLTSDDLEGEGRKAMKDFVDTQVAPRIGKLLGVIGRLKLEQMRDR